MLSEALSLAVSAVVGWLFEEVCFALGRWTAIGVTLGHVRPVRTIRSERWLGTLGFIELLTVVLGGFVLLLYR